MFLNAVDSFVGPLCFWLLVVSPGAAMLLLVPRNAMQQDRQSVNTLSNRAQFYAASGSALLMLADMLLISVLKR
jgi:hypothetical protein